MQKRITQLVIFSLLMLVLPKITFAQRGDIYYLKNSGKIVGTKDSADFVRVVTEPDSGTVLFNVEEYYPNGKLKMKSKISSPATLSFEGPYISFYPSGKKQIIATYKNGLPDGDIYTYYPNGKLYTIAKYISQKTATGYSSYFYSIQTAKDSTGKTTVTDGNGYFVHYSDDFKIVLDEGTLNDGIPQGKWKGTRKTANGNENYSETYINGVLLPEHFQYNMMDNIAQTLKSPPDKTGEEEMAAYNNDPNANPIFDGGMQKFYNFLAKYIFYPNAAKENGTQGKVILKFTVNEDGTPSDVVLFQDPGDGLGKEALRVFKLAPKWLPGKKDGRPVKKEMTIPVNFTLNDR
ncbi:energy transducer TonB [uncultured Mucilaginibacter sp.]|uniref:energy transducer TonB n=1 Tax=uncultured Mucilaginibacter sp. TaxID=797541 RepID=UPI0025D3039C|nr:energy transducer TonB [uncultured Mucilaginibacter sp.]